MANSESKRPLISCTRRAQRLFQVPLDGEFDDVLNPLPHQDFQRV